MNIRTRVISLCALSMVSVSTGWAQSTFWVNPVNGNWNDPSKWDGGVVPDGSTWDITLGLASPYQLLLDSTVSFNTLSITNPGSVLVVTNSADPEIFGDIVNNGTIGLNPGMTGVISFEAQNSIRIDGTGELRLNATQSRVDASLARSGLAVITNGAGHRICGSGRIISDLHNEGVIVADDAGGLGIEINTFTDITQSPTGRIGANGGLLFLGNGATITGGELFSVNGGVVDFERDISLIDIRIETPFMIGTDADSLEIAGIVELNDQIVVNSNLDNDLAQVQVIADTTLSGSGEVVLKSDDLTEGEVLVFPSGSVFTIADSMIIRGAGVVDTAGNSIVNNGIIVADDPSYPLRLDGDFSGAGTFAASNAELLLNEIADFDDCTFNTNGTGVINVAGEFIDFIGGTNNGFMSITLGGVDIDETFVNNGVIEIDTFFFPQIDFNAGSSLMGSGELRTAPGKTMYIRSMASGSEFVVFGPQQQIAGKGFLDTGNFEVQGTLIAEGELVVEAQLRFTSTTDVTMVVGQTDPADDSLITADPGGQIHLDGTLSVDLASGYVPAAGNSFTLFDGVPGAQILGSFAAVNLPVPPGGLVYEINEKSDGLYLDVIEDTSACPADLTGDGSLDFFDISAFLSAYTAMDPIADFDNNGIFDFFDVSAFLGAFSVGCP